MGILVPSLVLSLCIGCIFGAKLYMLAWRHFHGKPHMQLDLGLSFSLWVISILLLVFSIEKIKIAREILLSLANGALILYQSMWAWQFLVLGLRLGRFIAVTQVFCVITVCVLSPVLPYKLWKGYNGSHVDGSHVAGLCFFVIEYILLFIFYVHYFLTFSRKLKHTKKKKDTLNIRHIVVLNIALSFCAFIFAIPSLVLYAKGIINFELSLWIKNSVAVSWFLRWVLLQYTSKYNFILFLQRVLLRCTSKYNFIASWFWRWLQFTATDADSKTHIPEPVDHMCNKGISVVREFGVIPEQVPFNANELIHTPLSYKLWKLYRVPADQIEPINSACRQILSAPGIYVAGKSYGAGFWFNHGFYLLKRLEEEVLIHSVWVGTRNTFARFCQDCLEAVSSGQGPGLKDCYRIVLGFPHREAYEWAIQLRDQALDRGVKTIFIQWLPFTTLNLVDEDLSAYLPNTGESNPFGNLCICKSQEMLDVVEEFHLDRYELVGLFLAEVPPHEKILSTISLPNGFSAAIVLKSCVLELEQDLHTQCWEYNVEPSCEDVELLGFIKARTQMVDAVARMFVDAILKDNKRDKGLWTYEDFSQVLQLFKNMVERSGLTIED